MAPRKLTYAFHMQAWKRPFMKRYFKDREFVFVPFFLSDKRLLHTWLKKIDHRRSPDFFIWGLNISPALQAFAAQHDIKTYFVEDGFIRSARPHAGRTPPLSLTVDSRTPYFDSRTPSDLEILLATYDFKSDPELLAHADEGVALLLSSGLSKYNTLQQETSDVYGPKEHWRVLVVGQVDNDASIRFGCARAVNNDDIVRLAVQENPDAEVIYKPHPDVLSGMRSSQSNLTELEKICRVLHQPVSMAQAFKTIDHVYTITSLAGFEALLRGLPVTVMGSPFYGGWGLTDDRQDNPRRHRKLTISELFAGAYILYPSYFEPRSGRIVTFESVIDVLRDRTGAAQDVPMRKGAKWRPLGAYGLLGWRHLLRPVVGSLVRRLGTQDDVDYYNAYPIDFFRERPRRLYRVIGRVLYPFDEKR